MGFAWFAGTLWIYSLWSADDHREGIGPLSFGYGYLLGVLGIVMILRAHMAFGIAPSAQIPTVIAAIALIFGVFSYRFGLRSWRATCGDPPFVKGGLRGTFLQPGLNGIFFRLGLKQRVFRLKPACFSFWHAEQQYSRWQRILFGVLFTWILLRLLDMICEAALRPTFPWDAWTTWIVKAKVWSITDAFVPFTSPEQWATDSTGAYAMEAWYYPPTVSLIALWPTLGSARWNDMVAHLPWAGCAMALGLGFYGQARYWGTSPMSSIVYTWLLLSLPLLNTHVALAGYADVWMTCVLGLGGIAFFQWARTGEKAQGILALLLIAACPFIKREGLIWVLLFLPALARIWLSGRLFWLLWGLVAAIPLVMSWTGYTIDLLYTGRFVFGYHDSLQPVLMNLFVLSNWHLLGILLVAAGIMAFFQKNTPTWLSVQHAFIASSVWALYVLFFMTDAALWAAQYTSINRIFLAFTPLLIFWAMCVFAHDKRISH